MELGSDAPRPTDPPAPRAVGAGACGGVDCDTYTRMIPTDIDPELVAAWVESNCQNSPPNNTEQRPTELFKDYGDHPLDAEIGDLWAWGMLEVERRDGEQYLNLSEFAEELYERELADLYIHAKLGEIPDEYLKADMNTVRVLQE